MGGAVEGGAAAVTVGKVLPGVGVEGVDTVVAVGAATEGGVCVGPTATGAAWAGRRTRK